ncbi:hypothetical protein DL771_011048 [Monosporascus sp. 5C6A]|nr:hypothetical protein DL771_011048 [Monosporascus sp. 5C6A]
MDPLSVTASAIAVCQALQVVAVGIKSLATIRKAPVEFLDLQNELTTVIGYLELVHSTMDAMTTSSTVLALDLTHVNLILTRLENDVKELQDIVTRLETKPASIPKHGKVAVSKIKWIFEVDKILQIRDKIRLNRQHLADAFRIMQQSQRYRAPHLLHYYIPDLYRSSNKFHSFTQAMLILNVSKVSEAGTRHLSGKLDSVADLLANIEPSMQELLNGLRAVAIRRNNGGLDLDRNLDDSLAIPQGDNSTRAIPDLANAIPSITPPTAEALPRPRVLARPKNNHFKMDDSGSNTLVRVQTSIRRKCPDNCKCQCHMSRMISSPDMLTSLTGRLLLRYRGVSLCKKASCDFPVRLNSEKSSVQLNYMFPKWALTYAIYLCVLGLSFRTYDATSGPSHITPRP